MARWVVDRDPKTGDRTGRGLVEAPEPEKKVEITKPVGVTLPGGQKTLTMCLACKEGERPKFKLAALMANHFKREHDDKWVDKDSWREHALEVVVNGPAS